MVANKEIGIKEKLEKDLSENGIMAYIIAKHQQEYLDAIHGLKRLMTPSETAVMERLRAANRDFISRTDKALKKANIDISPIEELVMNMLENIETEFKKLKG
jgi:hypothetical protein